MSDLPVWLLDIDGVVNAIATKPDRSVWPADDWIRTTARADGEDWPILAARPVVDFIRQVHDKGRAEVRWHTTWQHDAANLAAAVGLPELPVEDCPEFDDAANALGGAIPGGGGWWKLPAAERYLDAGRRLVWTDDDARLGRIPVSRHDRLRTSASCLLVVPQQRLGLTRRQLRAIDEQLTEWEVSR